MLQNMAPEPLIQTLVTAEVQALTKSAQQSIGGTPPTP
jgi:hypothetical protein